MERLSCPLANTNQACSFYTHWRSQKENKEYENPDIIRIHNNKYFCLAFNGLSLGENIDELDEKIKSRLESLGLELSECFFVDLANNQAEILRRLKENS